MARIAICSALYPAALPFLDDFVASLVAATTGHEAQIVLAADGVPEVERRLGSTSAALAVKISPAPTGVSPSQVRQLMLRAALQSGVQVVVLADSDDVLLPNAVDDHLAALQLATISFGDMEIIGHPETFFGRAEIPERVVSSRALTTRNFMGFGNTALRADACATLVDEMPRDIDAVDWWLFTRLLDLGATAQRSVRPVARYRSHDFNVVGPRPASDPSAVLRRCRIVLRHYAALPATPERLAAAAAVRHLMMTIDSDAPGIHQIIATACAAPGVWYEDIQRMAGFVGAAQ